MFDYLPNKEPGSKVTESYQGPGGVHTKAEACPHFLLSLLLPLIALHLCLCSLIHGPP